MALFTTGACAIVDATGTCIYVGSVNHINLTSYATGLYAILKAVALSPGPVHITTDSLAVVQLFQQCTKGRVDSTWCPVVGASLSLP